MTDDRPRDDPDDDPGAFGSADGGHTGNRDPSRVGEWLSTLLRALERFERAGERDGTALDFDVSVEFGRDAIDESWARSRRDRTAPRPDRGSLGHRPPGRRSDPRPRRRWRPARDYHVTTRTHEDELIVTADVAGVDEDDVTVGFDDGTLVVVVVGAELERVAVPWADRTAAAAVRNGILTVRVGRDTDE